MRSLGLSNFTVEDYQDLEKTLKIPPVYNQIEVNPLLFRKETIAFFQERGIKIAAYKPLRAGKLLRNETLLAMATKYSRSVAQICIRWGIQHDFIVIPKSSNPKRMAENMKVFDFDIQPSDMDVLDKLTTKESVQAWHEHYLSRRSKTRHQIKRNPMH